MYARLSRNLAQLQGLGFRDEGRKACLLYMSILVPLGNPSGTKSHDAKRMRAL